MFCTSPRPIIVLLLALLCPLSVPGQGRDAASAELAREVATKGWLVFSARADNGSWDLFVSRPDGSSLRNITNTARFEEAAPRFSPDGTLVLYRRLARGAVIDHDKWGFMGQVIIARADGTEPRIFGSDGEYPWAAWMADGKHLSCLYPTGIQIVALQTGAPVGQVARRGIFQQLFPSPDGRWLCGTANVGGSAWNIVRVNVQTGAVNAVHQFQSCTPDWFPDSRRIIYSSRPAGQAALGGYGSTQLWISNGDGTGQQFIYGDDEFHVYGGLVSPDGKYVVFSKSRVDGGGSEKAGAPMFLMRLSDAPAISGRSPELRAKHPAAREPTLLALPAGWEPHWTYTEIQGP